MENKTESALAGKILFFDMDDTLISTQEFYNQVSFSCAALVKCMCPEVLDAETILQRKTEIDLENMKIFGLSPERFPTSWKQTLLHFIPDASETIQSIVEEQARKVFTAVVPVIESVEDVLAELKTAAKEMRLFTAGDPEIQKKRIEDSGLAHFFDDIHIVPLKTPEVMKQIISRPEDSVMIGNSLKSDIMPALSNNVKAVHIERKTWAYDQHQIDELDSNYIRLDCFEDLSSI